MAKQFTPDFLAALHAGAVPKETVAALSENTEASVSLETVETPSITDTEVIDAASPAPELASTSVGVPEIVPNDLVAHLRNELKDVRAELDTSKLLASKSADRVAALESAQPQLLGIVRHASEVMAVALGTTAVGLDTMNPEALVTYHGQLSTAMQKKYKIGQQSNTPELNAEDTALSVQLNANSPHSAHLAAVGSTSLRQ